MLKQIGFELSEAPVCGAVRRAGALRRLKTVCHRAYLFQDVTGSGVFAFSVDDRLPQCR